MPTLVTYGDRLITSGGRASWLKRPSVPLALFGRDGVTLSPDGRIASYQGLYESQPWVVAAVNKLSRGIMDLPIRLYREVTEDGEVEPVYRHPVMDAILNPWVRASAAQFKQKLAFPVLIHGNSVLGKVRTDPDGPPTGFVPLDWRFLIPWTLDDGEVFFWESTQPNRQQFWDIDDVVHLGFEGGTGDLGVSPLRQLGTTLRTEDSTQRYQERSFTKGIRPSGVLKAKQNLNREQRQALRDEIRAQGDGDFFLLTNEMEWEGMSHTAVEAELIEQRKLNREEVAAVYDVDPPLIGILDHATYSNVAEMHNRFYRATLRPWLTLISDSLTAQLIDSEPAWSGEKLFLNFDLSEVLKSDTPQEIAAAVQAIAGGLATPNEGRNRLRWRRSSQEGADDLYLPTNNLSPLGDEEETPPPSNGNEPVDEEAVEKRHLERAKHLIATKLGAGERWNPERFVKELYQDAPGIDGFALAAQLERAIADSDGNSADFRRISAEI